jgi:hypothetical protein
MRVTWEYLAVYSQIPSCWQQVSPRSVVTHKPPYAEYYHKSLPLCLTLLVASDIHSPYYYWELMGLFFGTLGRANNFGFR